MYETKSQSANCYIKINSHAMIHLTFFEHTAQEPAISYPRYSITTSIFVYFFLALLNTRGQ